MRDCLATRHFRLGAFLVDMDPLFVTGGIRKLVDAILGDLDPVADADLLANGGFEFVESVEYPHGVDPVFRASFPALCPEWRVRLPSRPAPRRPSGPVPFPEALPCRRESR